MCQRFKLSSSSKTLFSSLDGYEESFSLEETNLNQPALCLIKENGHYKVKYLTFGYSVLGKIVFNAKSETVAEKSLFKEDFRLRRALVPVTGFYEYDKNRIPHYFEEENKNRFYLAAIYHSSSFVLLTEKPEEAVSYYHPRMPFHPEKRKVPVSQYRDSNQRQDQSTKSQARRCIKPTAFLILALPLKLIKSDGDRCCQIQTIYFITLLDSDIVFVMDFFW